MSSGRFGDAAARPAGTLPDLRAAAAILDELAEFVRVHGAPCFLGWPRELLDDYFVFHAENGSLAYVRDPIAQNVIGLAIGWQCTSRNLERHWMPWEYRGDIFLFSQVVCAKRGALAALVEEFKRRVPYWRRLKLMARRRRKGLHLSGGPLPMPNPITQLVIYPLRFIERLSRKAENGY